MKHIVKMGAGTLDKRLTTVQAVRYGIRAMPNELKKVGFEVVIYRATHDINGWNGLRINYGKKC